eukprot:Gb_39431 [translate_table: standard]
MISNNGNYRLAAIATVVKDFLVFDSESREHDVPCCPISMVAMSQKALTISEEAMHESGWTRGREFEMDYIVHHCTTAQEPKIFTHFYAVPDWQGFDLDFLQSLDELSILQKDAFVNLPLESEISFYADSKSVILSSLACIMAMDKSPKVSLPFSYWNLFYAGFSSLNLLNLDFIQDQISFKLLSFPPSIAEVLTGVVTNIDSEIALRYLDHDLAPNQTINLLSSPMITLEIEKRAMQNDFGRGDNDILAVVECRLVVDPRTRESRGFGFVTMDTLEDAERCVKYLNRSTLEGRVITVEKFIASAFAPSVPMSDGCYSNHTDCNADVANSIFGTKSAPASSIPRFLQQHLLYISRKPIPNCALARFEFLIQQRPSVSEPELLLLVNIMAYELPIGQGTQAIEEIMIEMVTTREMATGHEGHPSTHHIEAVVIDLLIIHPIVVLVVMDESVLGLLSILPIGIYSEDTGASCFHFSEGVVSSLFLSHPKKLAIASNE